MYRIYKDNIPIYDLRDDEFIVVNPTLDLEVNKLGSLSFNIYPNHPSFDILEKRSTVLTVYKDNKTIYKGYIISDEQGLYNDKKIECEGVLGYLNDSIVRPYSFQGTPEQYFISLFNNHNTQVADHQQLKVGLITVTDPNDYIVRSSVNYASTWDILNEDLINKLGGYLRVRYEEDGTYVDYLEDFDDTSTQVIEFGENLIDVLVKNNAADVYTVVIPLGAEIPEEESEESTERLTIKSVNNGLDYIVNQEAFDKFGWIVAPVELTTWDDVTIAANLLTKGTNFLNNEAVMLKSSLEVSAIDLNVTNEQIEAFFIYEYVRFVSSVHNINQRYLLQKISIPMDKPQDMKITLGKETSSLTGIQMGNKQEIANITNIVEKKYQLNEAKTDAKIDELREETEINLTSIQQNQEEILMTALQDYVATGDFETFKETVSTQFSQTSEEFNFYFNNVTSQINDLNGETQQQFQEINKYIRFVDGTIVLGEAGNELTLVQQNDRISFMQNNSEVAYFSNNELTVTDARFLNSLRIGNFAWKPRANGNLSLVYVGGDSVG